jgi:hypothetical protein
VELALPLINDTLYDCPDAAAASTETWEEKVKIRLDRVELIDRYGGGGDGGGSGFCCLGLDEIMMNVKQCCGSATFCYRAGSDFSKSFNPDPTFKKVRLQFRIRT